MGNTSTFRMLPRMNPHRERVRQQNSRGAIDPGRRAWPNRSPTPSVPIAHRPRGICRAAICRVVTRTHPKRSVVGVDGIERLGGAGHLKPQFGRPKNENSQGSTRLTSIAASRFRGWFPLNPRRLAKRGCLDAHRATASELQRAGHEPSSPPCGRPPQLPSLCNSFVNDAVAEKHAQAKAQAVERNTKKKSGFGAIV